MSFNSSSFISLFTFLLDIYEVKAPLLLNIQRRIGETTKPRRRIDGEEPINLIALKIVISLILNFNYLSKHSVGQ